MKDNITDSNTIINNKNFEINTDTLVSYSGNESTVIIPSGIKIIDTGAFYYNHNIKKVIIPEGVVEIGCGAFKCCTHLEEVVFPRSLKEILITAFSHCIRLKKIEVKNANYIANEAFSHCKNLEEIILPDSPIHICGTAFFKTKYYLNENNWENGVLYIGNHLINAHETISGHCYIKEGTLDIASDAFFNSPKNIL